ncbi:MAG: CD225/dispanin family protein [Muribaculaceae bacterium]
MATKYWVNIDGIQSGPISRDELANLDFDPEVTYVWHQDLDDWQKIDQLPELADIVAAKQINIPSAEQADETSADTATSQGTATPPPLYYQCPPISTPVQSFTPPQIPEPDAAQEAPTHLVWAVIVTLLCCQITGIIAIIYGALASSANSHCNYERALKMSDTAQVWVMVSIAIGVVYMPIQIMLALL